MRTTTGTLVLSTLIVLATPSLAVGQDATPVGAADFWRWALDEVRRGSAAEAPMPWVRVNVGEIPMGETERPQRFEDFIDPGGAMSLVASLFAGLGGVLGVLPGMVGTMQATEVIKQIAGIGEPLIGRLLMIDALNMDFRTLKLRKNPECPVCSEDPEQTELIDYEAFCGLPSNGSDESESTEDDMSVPETTVQELKQRRDAGDAPFVLDVRKPYEKAIADIGADTLIPLDQLEDRLDELEAHRNDEIVVHCRSGGRSADATKLLREKGFNASNLKGGTLAWSDEIDDSVPKY